MTFLYLVTAYMLVTSIAVSFSTNAEREGRTSVSTDHEMKK